MPSFPQEYLSESGEMWTRIYRIHERIVQLPPLNNIEVEKFLFRQMQLTIDAYQDVNTAESEKQNFKKEKEVFERQMHVLENSMSFIEQYFFSAISYTLRECFYFLPPPLTQFLEKQEQFLTDRFIDLLETQKTGLSIEPKALQELAAQKETWLFIHKEIDRIYEKRNQFLHQENRKNWTAAEREAAAEKFVAENIQELFDGILTYPDRTEGQELGAISTLEAWALMVGSAIVEHSVQTEHDITALEDARVAARESKLRQRSSSSYKWFSRTVPVTFLLTAYLTIQMAPPASATEVLIEAIKAFPYFIVQGSLFIRGTYAEAQLKALNAHKAEQAKAFEDAKTQDQLALAWSMAADSLPEGKREPFLRVLNELTASTALGYRPPFFGLPTCKAVLEPSALPSPTNLKALPSPAQE